MKFECGILLRMGEGGYTEYRIPGIVEHRGEAVMCVEARSNTGTDWGRIDVMILGEEGRRHLFVPKGATAAEGVTPVICKGDTLNNPTLISDGDTLHLIFHVNYSSVLYTRSRDGGRTWAELREITDSYREFPYDWNVSATGPGHGIRLESGRLVAPIWLACGEVEQGDIYSVKHYPSVAGAVYSDDGGESWHAGALFADSGDIRDCNETACVQLSDGSLLFNIRHRGGIQRRALAISVDEGSGCFWMQADMSLEDPQCFGSMAKRDGAVYFVNCQSTRDRAKLGVKMLGGGAWEKCGHIDDIGGYADCAFVNGKLWVFYERTKPGRGVAEMLLAKEI